VGGDSEALAGHAERGSYDDGLRGEQAKPGYGVRDEFDADFAFQFAMRFPIIAAVNGAAAGVGLALALFCDLRFGAADARLTTAAPKLGLPAEYGMSWQLPRLVGVTRAADLLLSGRVFTPGETEGWGLWNGVEPDGEGALTAARRYAHHLAHGVGPAALTTTKAQLYADLLERSPAVAIGEARRLLAEAMTTEEYREGVAALREKRPPQF
jgi:enoyl-CoA hydratase/carnithine racemase